MMNFIKKGLFFLLPIVLVFIVLEVTLRAIPNGYSFKKEYLEKNAKDLEVLVLGSSHSYRGINPEVFSKKSFNASYVSQTLNYDHFIFDTYKDQLDQLEVLVLPISYQSLFSKLEEAKESWRVKNYVLYWDYPGYPYSLVHRSELFGQPKKGISHIKRFIDYYVFKKDQIKSNEFGFEPRKKQVKDLIKVGKAAAARHTISKDKHLAYNIGLVQEMIDFCKAKEIEVLLVTLPGFETYTQNLDAQQLRKMKEILAQLVTANPGLRYEDFLTDPRFTKDDFADADHLNEKGAAKFSNILNSIIKN